jgi:predicted nucleotidyltransferase
LNLKEALILAQRDLAEIRVGYAIVGGLAVSARVEPRMTRDIDFAIACSDDAQAESVVFELTQRGYVVKSVLEQSATDRLATMRLHPPHFSASGIILDLLFASSGIEAEVVDNAETMLVFSGLQAPIATTGHLIALKLLSQGPTRPQDAADLVRLLAVASERDIQLARSAVTTIASRGFNRGRDLHIDLDRVLTLRLVSIT